jgi:hypothetical protein
MYEAADRDTILTRIEREMAATVVELERGLRLGAGEWLEKLEEGRYRIAGQGVVLEIRARSHGERRIGALSLPLLWVVYEFHGGEPESRRRLLARLDRAMQRGGG